VYQVFGAAPQPSGHPRVIANASVVFQRKSKTGRRKMRHLPVPSYVYQLLIPVSFGVQQLSEGKGRTVKDCDSHDSAPAVAAFCFWNWEFAEVCSHACYSYRTETRTHNQSLITCKGAFKVVAQAWDARVPPGISTEISDTSCWSEEGIGRCEPLGSSPDSCASSRISKVARRRLSQGKHTG